MNDIYGPAGPSMMLGNQREGKANKSSVRYRQGGDHCGVCAYYVCPEGEDDDEMGTCTKVEGMIGEDDLCDLFLRAGHAKHEEAEAEAE